MVRGLDILVVSYNCALILFSFISGDPPRDLCLVFLTITWGKPAFKRLGSPICFFLFVWVLSPIRIFFPGSLSASFRISSAWFFLAFWLLLAFCFLGHFQGLCVFGLFQGLFCAFWATFGACFCLAFWPFFGAIFPCCTSAFAFPPFLCCYCISINIICSVLITLCIINVVLLIFIPV